MISGPDQRTARQHLFRRTFTDKQGSTIRFSYGYRQTSADKIKRQFVNFLIIVQRLCFGFTAPETDDRLIHQVTCATLVKTVQPRQSQYGFIGITLRIKMMLEDNIILCQRSCFIRAQDIHCAKVLYCIQPLNDNFPPRHCNCAFRQVRTDNHRQHFRG